MFYYCVSTFNFVLYLLLSKNYYLFFFVFASATLSYYCIYDDEYEILSRIKTVYIQKFKLLRLFPFILLYK